MKDWNEAHNAGQSAREAADNAWTEEKPRQNGRDARRMIMSSADFVAGYVAPQYLIEGIWQQRRIYSLTGKTGDGKTAIQLYLAYLLATGTSLGKLEGEQCRVLYLAGENPDDVRARWIAMSDALGFDTGTIDVHFVEGVFSRHDRGGKELELAGTVYLVAKTDEGWRFTSLIFTTP